MRTISQSLKNRTKRIKSRTKIKASLSISLKSALMRRVATRRNPTNRRRAQRLNPRNLKRRRNVKK